jgi:palmitoyl transferase
MLVLSLMLSPSRLAPALIGLASFAFAVFGRPAFADEIAAPAEPSSTWYGTAWRHVKDTARLGGPELYVPFYTYHMPYAYTAALLRSYNDFPAGAGVGLGRYNANGNWEGMFAMDFSDSHRKPEYVGGYGWIPTWRPYGENFRVGAGLTAFITARSDIGRYTPFPGILPIGSVGYGIFDVQTTFVPGGKNDGNVLFCWLKLSFH